MVSHLAHEIGDALHDTTFSWTTTQDRPSATLMVHIDDVVDLFQMTINVDSRFLSSDAGAEILRETETETETETVAVQAAKELFG